LIAAWTGLTRKKRRNNPNHIQHTIEMTNPLAQTADKISDSGYSKATSESRSER